MSELRASQNSNLHALPPVSEWVNTTPHKVDIYDANGTKLLYSIPANPTYSIRLTELPQCKLTMTCPNTGVRMRGAPEFGDFIGTFPPADKPIIVSLPVAQHMRELKNTRTNVFTPDSSPEGSVRDASGALIGVKGICLWQ
jgi:hypothetical protein